MTGPSIRDLLQAKDPAVAKELQGKLDVTMAAMEALKKRGETVEAYDQMIAEGNKEGNATVQKAIDGLIDQTKSIQRTVTALGLDEIKVGTSKSLDDPNAVFKCDRESRPLAGRLQTRCRFCFVQGRSAPPPPSLGVSHGPLPHSRGRRRFDDGRGKRRLPPTAAIPRPMPRGWRP